VHVGDILNAAEQQILQDREKNDLLQLYSDNCLTSLATAGADTAAATTAAGSAVGGGSSISNQFVLDSNVSSTSKAYFKQIYEFTSEIPVVRPTEIPVTSSTTITAGRGSSSNSGRGRGRKKEFKMHEALMSVWSNNF
jgi:hypothetical protein